MMDRILLEADKLNVSIPHGGEAHPILQDIGFQLRVGEILGIVGPSGSGKTITARALIGLLPDGMEQVSGDVIFHPDNGNPVKINALANTELDRFRKENVAMIFQNPGLSLNPSMRIGKQFRVVSGLAGKQVPPGKFAEILDTMGLGDPHRILSAYPHQLSGGELQRAIIGMTILKSPQLWIADEPTTALDAETRVEIVDLLRRVRGELGASMIYISHDIGTVRHLADRVLYMESGRIERITDVRLLAGHSNEMFRESLTGGKGQEKGQSEPSPEKEPVLEISEVSKQFGQHRTFGFRKGYQIVALKDVSFKLVEGEALGVIGPSGSGKSTLGRILTGLEKADKGSVRFRGKDLLRSTNREWQGVRKHIQLIHQNPAQSLTPNRTVQQHLEEALELSARISDKENMDREIDRLMEELGLSQELKSRYPFQISGGECQRVAIARALALGPSIVICDEITSALDRESQHRLVELMSRLQEGNNFSLIWITHDLDVIAQIADRIILLEKGEIVEASPLERFFEQPASEKGRKMLDAYRLFR